MPCPKKHNPGRKHRKHTPIVSEAQRGLFGAELARRRAGKARRVPEITTKELRQHLMEAKGKDLPVRRKVRGSGVFNQSDMTQGFKRIR
jgi:hypothetical protein